MFSDHLGSGLGEILVEVTINMKPNSPIHVPCGNEAILVKASHWYGGWISKSVGLCPRLQKLYEHTDSIL